MNTAEGEQLFLVVDHLFAGLACERVVLHQEDRFLRANLLAIATEDATQHVDFEFPGRFFNVANFRRTRWPRRRDADRLGRAHEFTKLARHAFGAALGILDEVWRPAITRRHGPFFL